MVLKAWPDQRLQDPSGWVLKRPVCLIVARPSAHKARMVEEFGEESRGKLRLLYLPPTLPS